MAMMVYEPPIRPIYVIKGSDEIVNNSTTLQNDDALVSPTLPANSVWEFELVLHNRSSTVADFKHAVIMPSGATLVAAVLFYSSAAALTHATYAGASLTSGGLGAVTIDLSVKGILRISSTAGTAQVQWAQNALEVSDTTVYAESYMKLARIS